VLVFVIFICLFSRLMRAILAAIQVWALVRDVTMKHFYLVFVFVFFSSCSFVFLLSNVFHANSLLSNVFHANF
jgi:hypothetical protein